MMNIYSTVDVAAVTEEVVEGVYAGQVYQDISSTEATGELSFSTHDSFIFTSYFGERRSLLRHPLGDGDLFFIELWGTGIICASQDFFSNLFTSYFGQRRPISPPETYL